MRPELPWFERTLQLFPSVNTFCFQPLLSGLGEVDMERQIREKPPEWPGEIISCLLGNVQCVCRKKLIATLQEAACSQRG
jgi:hypothetical protein